MAKELITILKLDDAKFKAKLSDNQKAAIAFSTAAIAVGGALSYAAKVTADFNDATIKAARATGTTTEAYSALKLAADFSGVSQETLNKSLSKLTNLTPAAEQSMARYGISVRNANGTMKDSDQVLNSIADSMKALKNPSDKAALAMEVFGAKGTAMVSMLTDGSEGLAAFKKEAEDMGLIVTQKAAVASEKFNDDLERITKSSQGLVNSIGNVVIGLVNQSGVFQDTANAIQSVTKFINTMDEDLRDTIFTIGGIVIAFGVLVGAIMAFSAIAPAVGAAMSLAFGPVGLIIQAVAIAVGLLTYATVKYWDQIRPVFEPAIQLVEQFKKSFNSLIVSGEKLWNSLQGMLGFSKSADDSTKSISKLGTTVKIVFQVISDMILVNVKGFGILVDAIGDAIKVLWNYAMMVGSVMSGQHEKAMQYAAAGTKILTEGFTRTTESVKNLVKEVKEHYDKNLFVSVNAGIKETNENLAEAKRHIVDTETAYEKLVASVQKTIQDWKDSIENVGHAWDDLVSKSNRPFGERVATLAAATDKAVETIMSKVNIVINAIEGMVNLSVSKIKNQLAKTTYSLDLFGKLWSKNAQDNLDALKGAEETRLKALEDSEAKALENLRNAEEAKLNALKYYKDERLLLLDDEYQQAKAKKEQEYQDYLLAERARYEEQLIALDEFNLSKEERRVTESMMEASWLEYRKMLEEQHQADMTDFSKTYGEERKNIDGSNKAELAAAQTESAAKIEAAEKESALRREKEKAASDARLEKLQKDKEDNEKLHQKAMTFIKWRAEVAMFMLTKNIEVAKTIATGISSAAQAFAALAVIPFVGPALGAAVSAMILATTYNSAHMLSAQPPPPPPTELFMAEGGSIRRDIMGGPSAGDVVPIRAMPGESMLDVKTTDQIREFVRNGLSSDKKEINIYFQAGAIQNSGNMDEAAMDRLGDSLMYRLRREATFS